MNILLVLLLFANPEDPAKLLADADKAFGERRYADATALCERLYEVAKDDETAVRAAAGAAQGFLARDLIEKGRPWLAKAKKRASSESPLGWSRYLAARGRFEWKADDRPKATKTFESTYAYCLKHEFHSAAVDAAHMVAITGEPNQQIEWAEKGIAAAEKGELVGWLGPLWNNLGVTWQEQEQWDKALKCYRKAREYQWRHGDERNKLAADWAVGLALERLGKTMKARQWLRPVLAWAERRHAEKPGVQRGEWVGLACRELGYTEMALYQRDKKKERLAAAAKLLERAWTHLKAARMSEWDGKEWKLLGAKRMTLRHWMEGATR